MKREWANAIQRKASVAFVFGGPMKSKRKRIAMRVFGVSLTKQRCPDGTCALPRAPLPRQTGGAHGARNARAEARLNERKEDTE